jgi:hypothetical protein
MKTVYTCEDYKIHNGTLTVHNPVLAGMIKDEDGFKTLLSNHSYNAIVCPDLFVDENGNRPNVVVFN